MTTVLAWKRGDTIPLSAGRTLEVVRIRKDDADELPVLVVEDLARISASFGRARVYIERQARRLLSVAEPAATTPRQRAAKKGPTSGRRTQEYDGQEDRHLQARGRAGG